MTQAEYNDSSYVIVIPSWNTFQQCQQDLYDLDLDWLCMLTPHSNVSWHDKQVRPASYMHGNAVSFYLIHDQGRMPSFSVLFENDEASLDSLFDSKKVMIHDGSDLIKKGKPDKMMLEQTLNLLTLRGR